MAELASVIEDFVRGTFNEFGEFYPPCHILIDGKGRPSTIASLEKIAQGSMPSMPCSES
jgi:hypothetical protein